MALLGEIMKKKIKNIKKILFASNNRGKYDELVKDFRDVRYRFTILY